ncbi:putative odorant receptor 92a isoform X2 [Phymastichus coffea]|uniref:putative odorant receptor 92a isoform X2 n=1 Tax=Phymastichus coffea TaxID=108790 RepID=UPI00273A9F9B|nr:putative odorant receptor 92a isoform X2 [Phymastichus coffea]
MATTILPLHFTLLMLLSAWCPEYWSSGKKFIYHIYSLMIIVSLISLNSFQMAKLFFVKSESFGEFNSLFSFVLSLEAAIVKASCYLFNRNKVDKLIGMFEEDCCLARDAFEKRVRRVYDDKCKRLAKKIFIVYELLLLSFLTTPLSFDVELRVLPYPVLLPYSLANPINYWLSYAHQAITAFYLGHIGITSDLIATGFMWQLCGQLEVLKHRLQELPGKIAEISQVEVEKQLLKECVHHHVHLYNIADAITAAFSVYIVFQFYVDALAICMSVYQLSTMTTGVADKLAYILYISIMLGRLFLNCYFGNEVAVQSKSLADAIFEIDWTPLSIEVKKNLSLMILRSSHPIMISNRAFVVKISYSGYNLLQSSV